jgi:hypothetical protein
LRAWQEGEAAFANKWSQIFSAGWETNGAPEQPVRAIPASGESADSAIQILTDDPEDKVNGEYWYLYHRYGRGWQCEMQMATRPDANGHRYDILHIRFSDGQKKRLYFLL